MERIEAIERLSSEGAQQTFSRKPGVAENAPFRNPATLYFVYNVAHVDVSPVSVSGARFRILRGFADVDSAREYAQDVHDHDRATVMIGETHAWIWCARSVDRLLDDAERARKTESLIDCYLKTLEATRDQAAAHKERMLANITSLSEWAAAIGVPPEDATRLCAWADENSYTVERCAVITDKEAQAIGIDGSKVRELHRAWLEQLAGGRPTQLSLDPVAEEPEEENAAPAPRVPRNKRVARFDPSLAAPSQAFAVISTIPDSEDTGPGKEPLLRVYGMFDSTETAEGYIQNVAGAHVRDHNMFVVDMYQWLDVRPPPDTPLTYREQTLHEIMQEHGAQPAKIEGMIERTRASGQLNASHEEALQKLRRDDMDEVD